MQSIEQKIIDTALEFKQLSLNVGKSLKDKQNIDQDFIEKKFETPQKVIHKLFELLDEYEFQKGISKKIGAK